MFRFGLTWIIFPLLLYVVSFTKAAGAEKFSYQGLENFSTGALTSLAEVNGTIFIGAENGLYALDGDFIEQLRFDGKLLSGGYISSISPSKTFLLVTIYGKGLFKYDLETSQVTQIPVDASIEKNLWSVSVLENKVIASYVGGAVLLDLVFTEKSYRYDTDLFSTDVDATILDTGISQKYAFTSISNGMIRIENNSGEYEFFKVSEYFPKLSSIDKFVVDSESVLIAGKEGVYESDLDFSSIRFIPFSTKPKTSVTAILKKSSGEVLLAAGDIFIEFEEKLENPNLFNPYLTSDKIHTVTKIIEGKNKQIYISSSQQGLMVLPKTSGSINYLSLNDTEFSSNILSSIHFNGEQAIIASSNGYYELSLKTGKLKRIFNTRLENASFLRVQDSILDVINCKKIDFSNGRQFLINEKITSQHCGPTSIVWIDINKQIIKYQTGDKTFIDIYSLSGELEETLRFPRAAYLAKQLPNGNLIALDNRNRLLVEEEGIWSSSTLPIQSLFDFSCLEGNQDRLFLCTHGTGLQVFKWSTRSTSAIYNDVILSRYIRDLEIENDYALVATNKGLSLLNLGTNSLFEMGTVYGIFDNDFSYSGINRIGLNHVLIEGDKLTYIIELNLFLEQAERIISEPNLIKLVYSSIDGVIDRTISTQSSLPNLPNSTKSLGIYVAAINATNSKKIDIQYQINQSKWKTISNSHGLIDLSDLRYGEYTLTLRAKEEYELGYSPVTTLSFTILPPFYLTSTAKRIYLALFILAIIASALLIQHIKRLQELKQEKRVKSTLNSLKDSSDMMGRILSNKETAILRISHEVRTPLILIREPLKAIAKGISDNKILDEIDVVERNAQRVQYLVEQLIEIEKLNVLQEIPLHEYDIEENCVYLIESLRPIAEQKNQTLTLSLKAKGKISLVQDTLQQIFYNLLSNAIKYSATGEEIKIATEIEYQALVIRVKDNGPGFSRTEKADIFKRFTRLENAKQQQGMGLGLSLLRQLIKANRGYIEVESKKGQGACFIIRLPLSVNEDKPSQIESAPNDKDLAGKIDQFNEAVNQSSMPTMLIAEDNDDLKQRLMTLFENDFLCFVANNGKDAIKAANIIRPKVLITDHSMPGMTGLALIETLRSTQDHAGMVIYMVSALQESETIEKAYELGIADFISKPFDLALLRKKVLNRYSATKLLANSPEQPSAEFLGRIPKLENEKDQQFYLNLRTCLDAQLSNQAFTRQDCASALFVSERQLNRKLKMILDISFIEVLKLYRIEKAKQMLKEGKGVTDTAYDCGFSTPSYFSTTFKAETNTTPSEYAKQL